METGQRKDKKTGEKIPRQIINKFTCTFNGTPVFSSDWQPAVAANPFLAFSYRAVESGTFHFEWVDDDGSVYSKGRRVEGELTSFGTATLRHRNESSGGFTMGRTFWTTLMAVGFSLFAASSALTGENDWGLLPGR